MMRRWRQALHASLRHERAAPALVLALAALVRLYELDDQPLWSDEAFSHHATTLSLHHLWFVLPGEDHHPALYYTLLKLWTALFGSSENALRGLSVLFGLATVPVLYLAGQALGRSPQEGRWLGVGAATLFALSPLHIAYAQEARPYAAQTWAVSLCLLGLLRLMRAPRLAEISWLGRGGVAGDGDLRRQAGRAWLLVMVGAALSLWFHNLGTLFMAALVPPLLYWWGADLRWSVRAWRNAVLAVAAILILWSPNIPWLLVQTQAVAAGFWLALPDDGVFEEAARHLFGAGWPGRWGLVPLFVAVELWGLAWLIRRGDRAQAWLLLAVAVLPVLLSLAFTYLVQPIFLLRTLIWVSLPVHLALAAGTLAVPRRHLRPVLTAAMLLFFAAGAASYHVTKFKEPWDRIARIIARNWQASDLVILLPAHLGLAATYYWQKDHGRLYPSVELARSTAAVTPEELARLERELLSASRIWLVTRRGDLVDPEGRVLGGLAASRPQLMHEASYGIGLYLFGPAAEPD